MGGFLVIFTSTTSIEERKQSTKMFLVCMCAQRVPSLCRLYTEARVRLERAHTSLSVRTYLLRTRFLHGTLDMLSNDFGEINSTTAEILIDIQEFLIRP